jgi:hypothetical protein
MESEEAKLPDGSGRTYMDIMNTAEEDVYESQYWTNRLAKQAACDMIFYGRINSGNMDAILMLSPEQQSETLALTVNFATKLQAYQGQLQRAADEQIGMSGTFNTNALTTPKELPKENSLGLAPEKEMFDVYNLRNDSQ